MITAPVIAPAPDSIITLPLVLTVTVAIIALVAVAIYVRRARRAGSLTGVTAVASGVSVAGILVSALAATLIVGGATSASAAAPESVTAVTNSVTSPASLPDGYQLPTR